FSSRRRHTSFSRDWSSDVCSSDLPERDTFAAWRDQTPPGFCAAVKMSRYLTHVRRLRDPAGPVARFLDRAGGLGDRLGPVLLQLPPNLPADPDALAATLACFPAGVRDRKSTRLNSSHVKLSYAVF